MNRRLFDICTEYIDRNGENENKRKRIYTSAVACLRGLNMTSVGVPKVIELDINDTDSADLPCDYLQYTKIALCNNGVMYSLGLNDDLCLLKKYDSCGNPVNTHQNTQLNYTVNYPYTVADNYRNGEFTGRMFGIGSDNNILGYYTIDKKAWQIQFAQLLRRSSVVMEYISDIKAVNQDFEVHPYCIDAILKYIRWDMNLDNKNAERQYYQATKQMRILFGRPNIDELVAALQSGNMAAPKIG